MRNFLMIIVLLAATMPGLAQDETQLTTAFELRRLPHGGVVRGARWSRDGNTVLTWSNDGWLGIWDVVSGSPLQSWSLGGWVEGAAWNASEDGLVAWVNAPLNCVANCAYNAHVWRDLNQTSVLLSHPARIHQAAWNPAQTLVLTAAADGGVRVWSVATGDLVVAMNHPSHAGGAAWSPDGQRIISWGSDDFVRVWDVALGIELWSVAHSGVDGATWNADGTQIISWGRDSTARVWTAADGTERFALPHQGWVTAANWQDETILTTSFDGTVRVWQNESEVLRLQHDGPVWGAQWRDDQLLSWSVVRDGWVSIWEMQSGEVLSVLPHPGFLRGASWNPAGDRVLTWSDDGWARIWVVPRPDDCMVTTPYERVNRRETPDGPVVGQLLAGEITLATAQFQGPDRFIWWRLFDGSWVRDDVVDTYGRCEQLPTQ